MPATQRLRTIKAYVHGRLAAGYTPRAVVGMLRVDWGLRKHIAEQYISLALVELHYDSTQEPLESVRARILAVVTRGIQMAEEQREPTAMFRGAWTWAQVVGVARPMPLEPPALHANTVPTSTETTVLPRKVG